MKSFFEDIFTYQHQSNQKMAEMLLNHEEDFDAYVIPLFSHMINAHQIWNSRIMQTIPYGVHDTRPIVENQIQDNINLKDSLVIISDYDLEEELSYHNQYGHEFKYKIKDILFHISNHHTHHRAQVVSHLRRQNIEPLASDFIFYKR